MTKIQELRAALQRVIDEASAAAYPLSASQDLMLGQLPFSPCTLIRTKHKDGKSLALVEMRDGERRWVSARSVVLQSAKPAIMDAIRAFNYHRFSTQGELELAHELAEIAEKEHWSVEALAR